MGQIRVLVAEDELIVGDVASGDTIRGAPVPQLLSMAGLATGGGMDLAGIIGSIASGGVGGGVLMAIIGLVKKIFAK